MTMNLAERNWVRDLAASIIKAVSVAGGGWLGVNGANAAGVDVPILNLKAFFVMLVFTAVRETFDFLAKRPLPESVETTTVTITNEKTISSTPVPPDA